MPGPQSKPWSDTRVTLLRVLAGTSGALTAYELAGRIGLGHAWVREALKRPIRCGWVSVIQPPHDGWGRMARKQYQITSEGRQHLVSLTEEGAHAEG